MFEVTDKAVEMIKDFLKDREVIPPIRVMLSQGGWSGPQLGLALDEQKDNDKIFDEGGLTFLVEDVLFERTNPLKIDYVSSPMGSGFSISSSMKPAAGCGSSCSC